MHCSFFHIYTFGFVSLTFRIFRNFVRFLLIPLLERIVNQRKRSSTCLIQTYIQNLPEIAAPMYYVLVMAHGRNYIHTLSLSLPPSHTFSQRGRLPPPCLLPPSRIGQRNPRNLWSSAYRPSCSKESSVPCPLRMWLWRASSATDSTGPVSPFSIR